MVKRQVKDVASLFEMLRSMGVSYAALLGRDDVSEGAHVVPLLWCGDDTDGAGVRVRVPLPFQAKAPRFEFLEMVVPSTSGHTAGTVLAHVKSLGEAGSLCLEMPETTASDPTHLDRVRDEQVKLGMLSRTWGLSEREKTVLSKVMEGKANKELALELDLSLKTVEQHVSSVLRKSGIEQRARLIVVTLRYVLGDDVGGNRD